MHCYWEKTEFPDFTFWFVFATCFTGDTATCRCNTVDSQLALVEQIHNAHLHKCQVQQGACCS